MSSTRLNARFPRKRAFITGASSGLGLELARRSAPTAGRSACSIAIVERLAHVEAESRRGRRSRCSPIPAMSRTPMSSPSRSIPSPRLTMAWIVMINNAGVAASGALMEVAAGRLALDHRHQLSWASCMAARAAIPHLQRNGTGMLINVASAAAFASAPGMVPYNATKAAVLSLSETLAGRAARGRHAGVGRDADVFRDPPAGNIPRPGAGARSSAQGR